MVDDYTFRIEQERKEKDHWFRAGHDSPIPHEVRHAFRGLDYYGIDLTLRFSLSVAGKAVRLHAYRPAHGHGAHDFLFVPFRDATSAKETYGAGRYLDLPFEPSGVYDVDFNRAYNPYCAYSDDYVCPFPPPENWLTVPIRAGEKTWGTP